MMCKGDSRCKQIAETGFIFVNRVKFVALDSPHRKKILAPRIGSQTFAWTVRIAPIFLTSYAIAWGFKP
ncbi:Uncharacterised protein [Enterobacter hormaechei]|nr:Uncharacterised protein [Enterobacter hormaechei]SAB81189.1 Uncharacterised protein [Enterobacter hormaechei]SAC46026.1 Uncharacterised protein [Enterobacter hormaechei]SAE34575.1 Uncharacterised protein [Enterobacter hormaechei]VAF85787.1 Uncharacterised protein [Enterobacter hormaechei]